VAKVEVVSLLVSNTVDVPSVVANIVAVFTFVSKVQVVLNAVSCVPEINVVCVLVDLCVERTALNGPSREPPSFT
jgi:hypothetical protein